LTRTLDPAETLVIVCSKTFVDAGDADQRQCRKSLDRGRVGEKAAGNHFVAVSTNTQAMDKFGIAADHRFTMWDWVGGRYSVWSAIGLIAEIVIGTERFEEFLKGAGDIDKHFTTTPFEKNLPVLMGLIGAWNRTFLNLPTLAVLPYDQRLRGCRPTCSSSRWKATASPFPWRVSMSISRQRPSFGASPFERAAFVFPNAASGPP